MAEESEPSSGFDPSDLISLITSFSLDSLLSKMEITEIQVKILIGKDAYLELHKTFRQKYPPPIHGTLVQTRYRDKPGGSGDVRLRIWYEGKPLEPKGAEVILKEDIPGLGINAPSRSELKDFPALETLALIRLAFDNRLNVYHDPHWAKMKDDFKVKLNGDEYRFSLQYLHGIKTPFGYVIEGSIKIPGRITTEAKEGYRSVILNFLKEHGLHEDPQVFQQRTDDFIRENQP